MTALALPSWAAAQQPATGAEWRAGFEVGPRPALLARWEGQQGGWITGVGLAVGTGEDPVQLRAMPEVRVGRSLSRHLRLTGALGLDWSRLGRGRNRGESEIQWELAAGWRTPASLLLEAGVRWTDYHRLRTAGVVRVSAPLAMSAALPSGDPGHAGSPPTPSHLGVPPAAASGGRLFVGITPVRRRGWGGMLTAANPRGDPDPRALGDASNVDRLAMGAEVWAGDDDLSGWARWRSDLHTDPSIAERTRAVAEGLSFPSSVSFSGGGAWRPGPRRGIEVAVRHDPQALLWMPHIASERTAGVTVVTGALARDGLVAELDGRRLSAIEGSTVDPLRHLRGTVMRSVAERTHVGVQHERLEVGGASEDRTRIVADHGETVRLRVAAGSDLAVTLKARDRMGPWSLGGELAYRSEAELLHFDALLARGWTVGGETNGGVSGAAVWHGSLQVERGPLKLEARGVVDEPVWRRDAVRPSNGGWMEVGWTDTLSFASVEGRARVASWGPEEAWWRETATASGRLELRGGLGAARARAWGRARTELRSARAGISEPAGMELGMGVDVPLPLGGSRWGTMARVELDDLLDRGLPVRAGAPRRGRRLTVVLIWNAPGDP